jgi:hypothetical protein
MQSSQPQACAFLPLSTLSSLTHHLPMIYILLSYHLLAYSMRAFIPNRELLSINASHLMSIVPALLMKSLALKEASQSFTVFPSCHSVLFQ